MSDDNEAHLGEQDRSILIVEDDEAIVDGLLLNLRLEGFDAIAVHDGEAALQSLQEKLPKLILLDISLPKLSGLEVLKSLRGSGLDTPVIVLSARQDEFDKVAALRLGADDYVTKPFGVAELLARVDAVLRRLPPETDRGGSLDSSEELTVSNIKIALDRREVSRDGEVIPMTHLEFELLSYLVQNARRVFTRRQLLQAVWNLDHAGSPRTVDNFIAQLRNKLEDDPIHPTHIVTVRGSGYRFDP
ncbi:MAG: response regulator transcription factor [Planctomycetota bacterium]|jgi:DNA-binding response OmpR family regulator